jgi:HlyD family secretion protein
MAGEVYMGRLKGLRWIIGVLALTALGTVLWLATRPPPLTVQGEVSSDRVDISPRVAGRIAKLQVDVGDSVERGAVITELESPQLVATLIAARAALSVAKADLVRINSTRPETIAARKAELAAAEADVTLNQETYDRKAQLSRTGNAPQAMVDDATHNLESAIRKRESAQAALQLATIGASPEEKALAAAQVKQAEAALNQRDVDVGELIIRAPIAAQVTTVRISAPVRRCSRCSTPTISGSPSICGRICSAG